MTASVEEDSTARGSGGPTKKRKGAGRPTLGAQALLSGQNDPNQLRLNFTGTADLLTTADSHANLAQAGATHASTSGSDRMVEEDDC